MSFNETKKKATTKETQKSDVKFFPVKYFSSFTLSLSPSPAPTHNLKFASLFLFGYGERKQNKNETKNDLLSLAFLCDEKKKKKKMFVIGEPIFRRKENKIKGKKNTENTAKSSSIEICVINICITTQHEEHNKKKEKKKKNL